MHFFVPHEHTLDVLRSSAMTELMIKTTWNVALHPTFQKGNAFTVIMPNEPSWVGDSLAYEFTSRVGTGFKFQKIDIDERIMQAGKMPTLIQSHPELKQGIIGVVDATGQAKKEYALLCE